MFCQYCFCKYSPPCCQCGTAVHHVLQKSSLVSGTHAFGRQHALLAGLALTRAHCCTVTSPPPPPRSVHSSSVHLCFSCCCCCCSGQEVTPEQAASLQALLEGSLLCNDSALSKDEATGQYIPNGAPTEVSLITAAVKAGMQPEALKQAKPRVASVPFESEHKVCVCRLHWLCTLFVCCACSCVMHGDVKGSGASFSQPAYGAMPACCVGCIQFQTCMHPTAINTNDSPEHCVLYVVAHTHAMPACACLSACMPSNPAVP